MNGFRFGHLMRREETNEIRTSVKYKPIGSRPRGRLKKRWMDGVCQDLERLYRSKRLGGKYTGSRLLEVGDGGSQNSSKTVKAHMKKK